MDKHVRDELLAKLEKNNHAYILITCSEPSDQGYLNIEMDYKGDQALASYLLVDAHKILEEETAETQLT